jgi:hypothetical protein
MRTALLTGLLLLCGCSDPVDCVYHHTEPGKVVVRAWAPDRDVYQCAGGIWIYKVR